MSADTITAIITPPGQGGIAALRITGPDSFHILKRLACSPDQSPITWTPRYLHFAHAVNQQHDFIDEITAVWLPGPHTYTGLDQAEIFCHGSDLIARQILETLVHFGARIAEPGEFTRLAFENGRMDLTKAEAVAELIGSQSSRATHVAREHLSGAFREHLEQLRSEAVRLLAELESGIDFTEQESYGETSDELLVRAKSLSASIQTLATTYNEGKLLRSGIKTVIAGRPNAGKSSLFNILCRRQRAIVSPIPGTTRDYLSEWIELAGFPVELIDTAGLRSAGDEIEKTGQQLAVELLKQSDLILWVVDSSNVRSDDHAADLSAWADHPGIIVANKSDLSRKHTSSGVNSWPIVELSCKTESGLVDLIDQIARRIGASALAGDNALIVTSARQARKLADATQELDQAASLLELRAPNEEVVPSVQSAIRSLDEISGRIYNEEVLGEIFANFCIGK